MIQKRFLARLSLRPILLFYSCYEHALYRIKTQGREYGSRGSDKKSDIKILRSFLAGAFPRTLNRLQIEIQCIFAPWFKSRCSFLLSSTIPRLTLGRMCALLSRNLPIEQLIYFTTILAYIRSNLGLFLEVVHS